MRYAALVLLAGLFAPVLMAIPPVPSGPIMVVEEMSGGSPVVQIQDNATADYGRVFKLTQIGQNSEWLTIRINSSSSYYGGGMTLNLTAPTLTAGSGDFDIDTTGFNTSGVSVGSYTEFAVRFTPQSSGTFTATATFTWESQPTVNPGVYTDFRVNFSGTTASSNVAYLNVTEDTLYGTRVFHDQYAANGRLFGARKVDAGAGNSLTLWIENDAAYGAPNLVLGTPSLVSGSAEWTLDVSSFTPSVAAGAACEITVTFDPATVGNHAGVIEFTHNDGIQTSPYRIQLSGTGLHEAEQIRVGDQGSLWFDTSTLPPTYTGTHLAENEPAGGNRDFGTVNGGNTATLTITVANADVGYIDPFGYQVGADLQLGTPTVSGDADFTVDLSSFSATVSSAGTTTFVVHFDPQADGVRFATIEIPHMDGSEREPFRLNVTGMGANVGTGGGSTGGSSSGGGACVAQHNVSAFWLLAALLAATGVATRLRREV